MWEKFGDVDGQGAEFVDSNFIRSTPAGGDYAGETGESTLAAIEARMASLYLSPECVFYIPSHHYSRADFWNTSRSEQLARRLQMEEDVRGRELSRLRQRDLIDRQQREAWAEAEKLKKQKKKEKDCVIM